MTAISSGITAERPSVAAVVVTYGNYTGLERTINSILRQNYPIQTLILSDDGSGIPFPGHIVSALDRFDGQVIVRTNQENQGTTAHLNTVATLCHTDYMKVLASGDTLSDPDALQALVAFAESERSLAVTSDAAVVSQDLNYYYYKFPGGKRGAKLNECSPVPHRTLMLSNVVSAVGMLIRMEFFTELGGFDESYRLLEDWPAWLRLTREGHTISYLERVTCCYALGGVSSGSGNAFSSKKLRADMLRCYEQEILPYIDLLPPEGQKQVRHGYESLKEKKSLQFWKKYLFLELKCCVKRGIKCILLIICKRKNRWSAYC